MFVAKNATLCFLCCLVIVTSVLPEGHTDSENVTVATEDGAGGRIAGVEIPDRGADAVPFQAQITIEGATFCSGTIIKERYILTAAHCVEGAKPQELTVRVGSNIRGEGVVVPIEEIVQHPDYDYPQSNFDIAYMRTAEDIPLLTYVTSLRAAFIDSPNASVPNELHVTGWGYQEDNQGKLADKIRAVDLPVISNTECQVFYPMTSITKNMICAYSLRDMDMGTCVGDGGDPATVGLRLVGVSSFARGCGPGMGPSVFTYVDAKEIRNFILNGISENDSQRPGHPQPGRPQKPSKPPEKHPDERPAVDPNYPDYIGETTKFPADYSDYDHERPGDTSQRPADYDLERPGYTSQRPAGDPNYPDYIGETTNLPAGDPNYPEISEKRHLQIIQIMIRSVLEIRHNVLLVIQIIPTISEKRHSFLQIIQIMIRSILKIRHNVLQVIQTIPTISEKRHSFLQIIQIMIRSVLEIHHSDLRGNPRIDLKNGPQSVCLNILIWMRQWLRTI